MQLSYRVHRPLLACIVALVAALPFAYAAAAHAAIAPPDVPTTIQAEAGNKPFLVRHAEGVQIYKCNPSGTGYAWGLVAPRATLYDEKGNPTGSHYGGPTWEDKDGSKVMATRVNGATVDPTAIPWLLLKAK